MDTYEKQLNLFLKIAGRFNQISEIPGIYGSLGLLNRLSMKRSVKDIDFLIDDLFFSKKGSDLVEIVTDFNFIQDTSHEHEFISGSNAISFFGFDGLFKLTGIKSADIPIETINGIKYRLPTEKQFLKIYQAGLENKWREEKKEKEDLEKIDLIKDKVLNM